MMSEEKTSKAESTFDGLPFMDTFYSLSSNDQSERNYAAYSLLHHLFHREMKGENASDESEIESNIEVEIKDGCYAFTRLLNGLCSGRASARQGYASCLSSFLKLSFQSGPLETDSRKKTWMDLFKSQLGGSENITAAEFVRQQLLQCTSKSENSKDIKGVVNRGGKGSEERDYMFGKLFGILAVARSGTLAVNNVDPAFELVKGYSLDLLELYEYKKWMRESATHALKEFLTFVSAQDNAATLRNLINTPQFISFFEPRNNWTAEKIAVYLHLQMLCTKEPNDNKELPYALKTSLLTVSSLEGNDAICNVKSLLKNTSSIVYPRCHMVWDSVWAFLAEESIVDTTGKKSKRKNSKIIRVLRNKAPVGNDAPKDILEALVNSVIVNGLLCTDIGDLSDKYSLDDSSGVTHERRALALSLVHQLCDLKLSCTLIEQVVLHPKIVGKLFIQTLQKPSKSGGKSDNKMHTLQPLALNILEHIVQSFCYEGDDNVETRLTGVKSFVRVSPSFDVITNTQTVSLLLSLDSGHSKMDKEKENDIYGNMTDATKSILWKQCFEFLEQELFQKFNGEAKVQDAIKLVDLIFSFTKQVMRVGDDSQCQFFFRRSSFTLMICAFFNLASMNINLSKKESNEDILSVAKSIHGHLQSGKSFLLVPYKVRVIMSSRFFSLLSDYVGTIKRDTGRESRIDFVVEECFYLQRGIKALEKNGAILIHKGNLINDRENDCDGLSPLLFSMKVCEKMHKDRSRCIQNEEDKSNGKYMSALLCLISSLSLQLLHPGEPTHMNERLDSEDTDEEDEIDDVFDEVYDMISDLSEVASSLVGTSEEDDGDNPLSSLAVTCVDILSSSIGGISLNQSVYRSGGSKLIRDCVQMTWGSFLTTAINELPGKRAALDEEVLSVLLNSVCSPRALSDTTSDGNQDVEMNDSRSDDESMDDDLKQFNPSGLNDDDMENDESSNQDKQVEEIEEEIELDPVSLENLLLQDSDNDESVEGNTLEHHSGADSALASLIRMKQEARKAGQNKREKVELANRMRCFPLLDTVFASNRNNILSNQIILMTIIPLLRSRTILLKSLNSVSTSMSGKKCSSMAEKRVLLDRTSSFLENRVCKLKLDGMANYDACVTLSKQIMHELKSGGNIDHSKCCSSLLIFVVKAVAGGKSENFAPLVDLIYAEAVEEWSQKKNTKVQSLIFDDLINKQHSIAKTTLVEHILRASKEARSSYLRSESFRMLASLYNMTKDDGVDIKGVLKKNSIEFAISIGQALDDDEMTKVKRIRDVLKATEKLVDFVRNDNDEESRNSIVNIASQIQHVVDDSSSPAVKAIGEKLVKDIEIMQKEALYTTSGKAEKESESSKTNKKKKKGKKKKGKKK